MTLRYDTVTLLSDYGYEDETAGVVRSVIRSVAPKVTIVDLSHGIDAYDVRAAALTLTRAAEHLSPGIVVCDVDSAGHRAVAVEVGEGDSILVGPDNGVLAPVVAMVGGAGRACVLSAGGLSAGRDVFAPIAARLCNGEPLESVGQAVDPASLRPFMLPFSVVKDGAIEADVLWIDRYGNVQLNLTNEQLAGLSDRFTLEANGRNAGVTRAASVAEAKAGATALVPDSHGLLALMVDHASAAERLGLSEQDSVVLRNQP